MTTARVALDLGTVWRQKHPTMPRIASVLLPMPLPEAFDYVTAKHALEGLSKVTALEGAEHGVTSNCLNPGYVRTALVEAQIADQARTHGIPESEVVEKVLLSEAAIKRLLEPAEVADLALWLCGDTARSVTGSSYTMDGGWSAR